jgi:PAS domain S-box-containing protein
VVFGAATIVVVIQAARVIGGIVESADAKRKQAEEMVRGDKEEWENTFNSVPDLIAILDCQHHIVRVNRAMAERLGLTPEQCAGARCHEVVHGAQEPPGFCPHALTCRDGQEHLFEVYEPRLGGDFMVSTTPMFDEQGQITGTVHVARDITERKRMEASQSRLAAIVESSDAAIIGKTLDGVVTSWNRGAEEIYGYTAEEVVGRSISLLTPNDRLDEVPAMLHRISCGQDVKHHETLRRRKDGEIIDVSLTISAIRDTSGNIIGASTIARDVTERKQMQREREKLISELRDALAKVKLLSGFLPICASCKNIRNDKGYWQKIEAYIGDHSEVHFSHGMCPDCAKKLYSELFDKNPGLFDRIYPEASDK